MSGLVSMHFMRHGNSRCVVVFSVESVDRKPVVREISCTLREEQSTKNCTLTSLLEFRAASFTTFLEERIKSDLLEKVVLELVHALVVPRTN